MLPRVVFETGSYWNVLRHHSAKIKPNSLTSWLIVYLVYLITVKMDRYLQTQSASVAEPPDLSRAVWRLEHRIVHLACNICSAFPWRQASSISYFRGNYIRAQHDGSVCQGKQHLFSLASSASESNVQLRSDLIKILQVKTKQTLLSGFGHEGRMVCICVCVYVRLLLI